MSYNASSKLVSEVIRLSAEIVVGLGTTLTRDAAEVLFNDLETVLGDLDVADDQPSGRYERALIKAADRSVQHFALAKVAGDLNDYADNVAVLRDSLNFNALSKAVMAFDSGEATAFVDHMLPTVYIWQEPLPEGTPVPSGDQPGQLYWRVQPFDEGRPLLEMDHRVTRCHYKTREGALEVILEQTNFGSIKQPFQIVDGEAPKPYLYILMRNDLASLNAGKAVAQGTHAANQMVAELTRGKLHPIMVPAPNSIYAALAIWEKEANGFGTCIVLSVNEAQMRASVAKALGDALPSHAGICHDPTYPLLDGKTLHLIPVDTCAYVFDYPARAKRHLVGYPLMP